MGTADDSDEFALNNKGVRVPYGYDHLEPPDVPSAVDYAQQHTRPPYTVDPGRVGVTRGALRRKYAWRVLHRRMEDIKPELLRLMSNAGVSSVEVHGLTLTYDAADYAQRVASAKARAAKELLQALYEGES